MTVVTGLMLVRPTRRRRGRRWRVLDAACERQEHYRDLTDCRCQVFANKADALAYLEAGEAIPT